MKGDFSRLTFDQKNQFTRVLMQQGRVQLDADWNEQAGILLHYLQALAADLIGPSGGPEAALGFKIEADNNERGELVDLKIGNGRYYVDGLLCENLKEKASHFHQPGLFRDPETDKLPGAPFLAYLDVWERHVNHLQVDGIREVALGGPDTATRAQTVWQVRVAADLPEGSRTERVWPSADSWKKWVEGRQPQNHGSLKARAKGDPDSTDPCLASPEARYRGAENQLYRVEIQEQTLEPNTNANSKAATRALTFKWSRENGSVVFAIREVEGRTVVLESLGRDEATGLKRGDWVEIVDDDTETGGRSWSLMKVDEIHEGRMSVTLKAADDEENPDLPVYEEGEAQEKHALLRRWDHTATPAPKTGEKPKGGVLFIFQKDAKPEDTWLTLEQGIQIQFQPGTYRPGDYWLIPARTVTGDVEWPGPVTDPQAVPPHGVEHHYAPLALMEAANVKDLRSSFKPLGVRGA